MTGLPTVEALVSLAVICAFAPLVPGIAARTRARLTGRRGPPIFQLYADLYKLARRGTVRSSTATVMTQLAPVVVASTAIVATALLPLDGGASVLGFAGDAVAFVYVLALGRLTLVLGALDAGSSFEAMGASREVAIASLVEPGFFFGLATLTVLTHQLSLTGMSGAAGAAWTHSAPAVIMVAAGLFALLLADGARGPVDDPTTHLELTMIHEVMVLDQSGPDLALLLFGSALKLVAFAALIVAVVVPRGALSAPLAVGALLAGVAAIGVLIGLVEATTARLRMATVPLYLATATALLAFALVLVVR